MGIDFKYEIHKQKIDIKSCARKPRHVPLALNLEFFAPCLLNPRLALWVIVDWLVARVNGHPNDTTLANSLA